MQKFSLNEQRQIVGSHAKLQEFHNGEDITKLFNRIRPDYPLGYYSDVFGYNSGMDKIEDKIFKSFSAIKGNVSNNFSDVWQSEKHFTAHIEKRIKLNHISNKDDYIKKTLECLANSNEFIFAEHSNSWDNICYNSAKDWAVIFNEHGKVMTSYKIESDSTDFMQKQKSINAKIKKGITDEKFRKFFNSIRN